MEVLQIKKLRDEAWKLYLDEVRNDEVRKAEVEEKRMTFGEATMRYGMKIMGEPDEEGYPLYIALHGGGGSDTPDINNQQWEHMGIYYADSVKQGIYINPRGVRDTWDCHANPESYPLYDRLIENMIAFYNADPNRVYICGYSAGGDGVYMIAPRMADRFAACHMSAGHHNGTSVTNLYNTPIQLQVGQNDYFYDRHKVTVQYMQKLDRLQEKYHGGYIHSGFVNFGMGHNFRDWSEELQPVVADPYKWLEDETTAEEKMADINAIHFLQKFVRNPLPEKIVWDLGNRADQRQLSAFYWLEADKKITEGIVVAHRAGNTVTIEENTTRSDLIILLNEDMVDVSKPVTIENSDGTKSFVTVEVSEKVIEETTKSRGDKNFQFIIKVKAR